MSLKTDGLLSLITFSEKRKDILFLLKESPQTTSDIKDFFGVKTPEIAPRIKELIEGNLIEKVQDRYQLTIFGETVLHDYKPLLDTLAAIEANETFWKTHDISGIPDNMMHRIKELKNCKVDTLDACSMFDSHAGFVSNSESTKHFRGAACAFNPTWVNIFTELSKTGAHIEFILTTGVYKKLKNEHTEKYEIMVQNKVEISICDSLTTSFAVTDPDFFSFGLYRKDEKGIKTQYDNIHDLMGQCPGAYKWGEDLFNHYKAQSVKIEEVLSEPVKLYSQPLAI